MLAHSSFVHAAPLPSAPPSVLSSPSSQSGAPAVAEGEPTVPEDGEGEKCVCVCTVMHVRTHAVLYALQMSASLTSDQLVSWTGYQMWTTHIHCSSVPRPLSPCVGPGQVPTPGGLSPPASTGGAAQTKSQAGVTGNACCLVGEGGEGNLTARSHN